MRDVAENVRACGVTPGKGATRAFRDALGRYATGGTGSGGIGIATDGFASLSLASRPSCGYPRGSRDATGRSPGSGVSPST